VILATWVVKIGRIAVAGQPRLKKKKKKFVRPSISTNSWAQWCALIIPATAGSINRRITVQAG
jgi:hypothetical protein